MDDDLTIDINTLRVVIDRVLTNCTERFGERIDLSADHYWTIWPTAAFDLARTPEVLAGQISDDVASIVEAAQEVGPPIAPWHDLGHALGILTRLAALLLEPGHDPS